MSEFNEHDYEPPEPAQPEAPSEAATEVPAAPVVESSAEPVQPEAPADVETDAPAGSILEMPSEPVEQPQEAASGGPTEPAYPEDDPMHETVKSVLGEQPEEAAPVQLRDTSGHPIRDAVLAGFTALHLLSYTAEESNSIAQLESSTAAVFEKQREDQALEANELARAEQARRNMPEEEAT